MHYPEKIDVERVFSEAWLFHNGQGRVTKKVAELREKGLDGEELAREILRLFPKPKIGAS